MTNLGGRPLKFKTLEEIQKKINDYFDYCDARAKKVWDDKVQKEYMISDPAPYTMHGLARSMGIDRDTLINYSHKKKFFGAIKEARERVAEDVETRMMDGKAQAGSIFNLKNNFGWKDKTEQDITTDGKPLILIDTKPDTVV